MLQHWNLGRAWCASWWVAGLVALSPAVHAQAPAQLVGFVKTVSPEAEVLVDGKGLPATPGMPLQTGFRVKTGQSGTLGVTFRDNTMISFGPNTEFVVDEYLYAPAKGELKLSGNLIRGSLQYISGVIAKLKEDSVSIRTPKGIVGLRGTRVVIMVEE
jgi:hypothetical protein